MTFKVGDKVRLKKYVHTKKMQRDLWIPHYIAVIMRKAEMTVIHVDNSRIPIQVEFFNPDIRMNDIWWVTPEYLEPTKEMKLCDFLEQVGSNE